MKIWLMSIDTTVILYTALYLGIGSHMTYRDVMQTW